MKTRSRVQFFLVLPCIVAAIAGLYFAFAEQNTALARILPASAPQNAIAKAATQTRTLSFADRVTYQRAIEEVYWRHRIWPRSGGERPDPKPPLDAVMSQAQLEKNVEDYLRKSGALEDYWQRPITAEQLQGEMDRMAQHTRQPEVLRELFEALGNDPFVIAECLARPALAERFLRSLYAYDQRIHGELKHRAEADLLAHPTAEQMKQTSGTYSEIEFIKDDGGKTVGRAHRMPTGQLAGGAPALQPQDSTRVMMLNAGEWSETIQKLAETFSGSALGHSKNAAYESIPVGRLCPLQEDERRYYATAVIEAADDHVRLATFSWLKESLESWLAKSENQAPIAMMVPSSSYRLPTIPTGGCIDDTWTATSTTNAPLARYSHTAVWTGSEMIVWGGVGGGDYLETGGRYSPSTDSWTATSITNAPGCPSLSHRQSGPAVK